MDFLALCALVIIASCWYRAFIHVYFSRIVEGNRHTRTVSSTGSVGLSNTSTREGAGYFIVMISFLCCSHTPFGSAVSYSECLGLHYATTASVWATTGVGGKHFPVHPKGVKRSGLCAGQSGSSTPNWLCSQGHYQVETGKDLLLTVATVGSTLLFEIILYSVAVQVQSQKTMTNSLRKKQKKHSTYENKVLGLKKHRNFPLMFAIWM